jgi:hypothetical protein
MVLQSPTKEMPIGRGVGLPDIWFLVLHFSGNRVNQDLATISEWPTNCTHTFIRSQSENAKLSH